MASTIRIRVNRPIGHGFLVGSEVSVPTFPDGTPESLFWRRRLRDARIDGCVEVVESAPAPASATVPVEAADRAAGGE